MYNSNFIQLNIWYKDNNIIIILSILLLLYTSILRIITVPTGATTDYPEFNF